MKEVIVNSDSMASNDSTMSFSRKLGLRPGQLPLIVLALVVVCIVAKVFWPSGVSILLQFLSFNFLIMIY